MQIQRRHVLASLGALLSLPVLSVLGAPARAATDLGAFLDAVRRGRREVVERMLAEDATLARARDDAGRSAYVLAWVHGHAEVAALLRETGLELDLVEAVLAEDWARVEALAAAHPEELARAHPIGGTPLYAAALVGSLGFWRLRSLGCAYDAAPAGGSGFTPARGALESAHASWARIALADLCGNGSDVNARQRGGSSVLHGAVQRRDELLVRLAIRKGADVDARDDEGRTARALALELGWEAGAQLLARHTTISRDNRASRFALDANREPIERPDLAGVPQELQSRTTGASHANLAQVRELVESDPRLVFSISNDDELAIEACAHLGNRPIIRYHLDHGAPLSLPTAVSLGDEAAVGFWLERDPTLVHERGAHDFPLLWYALLGRGSVAMAELLVRHGVPVDQESMGTTTLHWCVRRGDADLLSWLVEHGADPEAVGFKWSRAGQTPLQVAVAHGDTRMAALLRAAGARR
jgi:ankyrin repeat protein